jgi:Rrf2 family transcriptional regulator, iron-sulfur cluster assembly transcription factor
MSIIFSRQCEYALQAVSYLSLQPEGRLTSIRTLTKKLKIPYHFLAKILQDLTYKKLLISQKGPSGGFALALLPEQITLFHIVEAIDGDDLTKKCAIAFSQCSGKSPCALHHHWEKLR